MAFSLNEGGTMKAGSFPCDFCGSVLGLYCYPTEIPPVEWHACPICVALIRSEDWTTLIERIIAAFAAQQFISNGEKNAFRHELESAFRQSKENQVNVSRSFYFRHV